MVPQSSEAEVVQKTGHFVGQAIFVTAPMWFVAVLLFTSNIRPHEMKLDVSGMPVNTSAKIAWLESELSKARGETEEGHRREQALEATLASHGNPFIAKVDSIRPQRSLAAILCVMGLVSIVGPSSFVRFYLALLGSAISGLLVAAFLNLFAGYSGSPFLMDCILSIVNGDGSYFEYLVWGFFFFLGFLRWVTGWECGFYAYVDEVEMGPGGSVTVPYLARPLLANPSHPPPLRDAV